MRLPRKIKAGFVLASIMAVLSIAPPGYGARPPVEQPLIREGDFAVQLAKSFNLATTDDETQAESSLAAAAIAPRNGWMADYPVTPDIVAEIQDSAGRAASSGRLAMDKDTAVRTVQRVLSDMGLPISGAGARGDYGQAAASREWLYEGSSSEYESSSSTAQPPPAYDYPEVEDYYYDYGPPVVSYYVPPWDYSYLYSWVPWPFWWGGFWFGGYFVLNDFDVVVFNGRRGHGRHGDRYGRDGGRRDRNHSRDGGRRVSNHSRDANGRAARIDPANRLANVRGAGRTGTRLQAAGTNNFQRSGRSIANRDATRSLRNNTGRSALNGAGSNMAQTRTSTGRRSLENATGRTPNTGRSTALSRPSTTGRYGGGSGTVGRNLSRISPGYGTPRTSSGYISRGAPPSGFRSGGSFSGRASGGSFSGRASGGGSFSGRASGGSFSGRASGGSFSGRASGGGGSGGFSRGGGSFGGSGGSHGGGGGRR